MTEIYQESAFTISALSFSDHESGMFTKLSDHSIQIRTYSMQVITLEIFSSAERQMYKIWERKPYRPVDGPF